MVGIEWLKIPLMPMGRNGSTLEKHFNEFRKSHNQGYLTYTQEMRAARTVGLLTGLPDAYGRGRIIGDYRRIALYGIDF